MTAKPAKEVYCNNRKTCPIKCKESKPHKRTHHCRRPCKANGGICIPVTPRKPSPAKPTISMDMRKAHEEEWYGLRSADEKLDFVWSMLIKLAKKLEKVK